MAGGDGGGGVVAAMAGGDDGMEDIRETFGEGAWYDALGMSPTT